MTRVLYWNINNFTRNKIYDTSSVARRARSRDRKNHILAVLAQNTPDVFVIGEVYDRTREVGHQGGNVNSGRNVGIACRRLLRKIRGQLGARWMLVPPLKIGNFGRRESVAVFYDSGVLRFTGPWVHATVGGLNRSADPLLINSAAMVNYSANWRNGLPVPGNPFNAVFANGLRAVPEWRGAAQWEFTDAFGMRLNFPGRDDRPPYHVTFRDAAGRDLHIYAIHTSPANAAGAVGQLIGIPGIAAPAANDVAVVIGDFNIDSFGHFAGVYGGLRGAGYDMVLNPNVPGGAFRLRRDPYCMTHLISRRLALPYNNRGAGIPTDPTHNVYPRLGYMGGTNVGGLTANDVGSIDNAFVNYGAGLVRPARYDTTVVNTVVGTPYTALMPLPAGVTADISTDGLAYASSLANAVPLPNGWAAPGPGIVGRNARLFRTWPNFGVIYSTSDHLGLLVDV